MAYVGSHYVLLFFFYGLAFFIMGVVALLQTRRMEGNLPLLKSIHLLGGFGLLHGSVEWLLMFYIARIYAQHQVLLMETAIFLNALSFLFLWLFGIRLFEGLSERKPLFKFLPYGVFLLWFLFFYLAPILREGPVLSEGWFQGTMSRYLLGFPAGLTAFLALRHNAQHLLRAGFGSMARKVRYLGHLFLLYALLAGVIVRDMPFFPANWLNTSLFLRLFHFPVELGRAAVALLITLLFVIIIDDFMRMAQQRLATLLEHEALNLERRRLGRELHDVVLQSLFAAGIRADLLLDDETDAMRHASLKELKTQIEDTIASIRQFLRDGTSRHMEVHDFHHAVETLLETNRQNHGAEIHLDYALTDLVLSGYPKETLNELYFILQEALQNAVKHTSGQGIQVLLQGRMEGLELQVLDKGKGFQPDSASQGYGLLSMQERARSIGAILTLSSTPLGTRLRLLVPSPKEVSHG